MITTVSLHSSFTAKVTLFAVFSDGSVIAQQDNLPRIKLKSGGSTRWNWTVVSTDGFSGTPLFWTTHPNPDNTDVAQLHWAGIDNQDWQFGREGTVTIEALPASTSKAKQVLKVKVAIRSIDQKDLTFFTPRTVHRITACKTAEFDHKRHYSFKLVAPSQVDGYPFPLVRRAASGQSFDVRLRNGGHFREPEDSWLDLQIKDGASLSRLRLRVCTRPLTIGEDGSLFGMRRVDFLYGAPLSLQIAGDPSSTVGFSWEVQDFDPSRFKLEPFFKPMGKGTSADLALDGLSEWDWINGTRGLATLVVTDGRRQPARLPFLFRLEPITRRFTLTEGTKLTSADGRAIEVAEDGEFEPVIDRRDRRNPVIRLHGVRVRAVDKGAGGNLPGASMLTFDTKQPLLGDVVVGPDGMNMGDDAETDDELRNRVRVLWANPPAHGNCSHVLKIAEAVAGVDRAFVYPPLALDGLDGLGKVGCALVAPGRRSGVGRNSALAIEVLERLRANGSFTADYVMMDVDEVGKVDSVSGRGACQVDVEIQLRLTDDSLWRWKAAQNLVIRSMSSDGVVTIFHDPLDADKTAEIDAALAALADGDQVYILGFAATVGSIDNARRTLHLSGPLLDGDGNAIPKSQAVGQRVYPVCPIRARVEEQLDAAFKDLGTSEAPPPEEELPVQRRFPAVNFRNPNQLRVAEIINRLMDLDGVEDLRVLSPAENVQPPSNETIVLESGERIHRAYILSLRRIMLGPMRPTPGIDAARGYSGPTI